MGIMPVTDEVKEGFNLPEARGALVQNVEPGKPAARAGIQPGDVIVEIDGRKITTNRELIDYISYLPVGSSVHLTVIRDGQKKTITANTAERPLEADKDKTSDSTSPEPARNKLGMSVQEITPALRQNYGIDDNVRGVVVTQVKEVSPAGDAVREGDVITEVQGQKVTNVSDFRAAVDRAKSGQTIRLYVITPGQRGNSVQGYRFIRVP
jgi:serine protease Do